MEVPPPGVGLNTVTRADPVLIISEAEISAANELPLIKVVGLLEPFQRTTELLIKLLPLTVRVNPGLPTVAERGLRLLRFGLGLLGIGVGVGVGVGEGVGVGVGVGDGVGVGAGVGVGDGVGAGVGVGAGDGVGVGVEVEAI